jgi:drug/metabolite transporter (DMT)-like permease
MAHGTPAQTAIDTATRLDDEDQPPVREHSSESPDMTVGAATKSPASGITHMLVATFCFASMDAMSKHLTLAYSPVEILWVRFICFAIFAAAISGGPARAVRELSRAASAPVQILRALLLVVEMALFVLALRYMGIADAHVLMATGPLVVTGLSVMFLGERVGIRRWTAVLIGLVGVVIVLRPDGDLANLGAAYMVVCMLLFAAYQVLTRKVSATDSARVSLLYVALGGLAALSLVVPFAWTTPTLFDLSMMVALGFVGAFAHFVLIKAFEAAPASVLQPFFYMTLVWALPVGFLIYGDIPAPMTLLGAAVIVGSGLYTLHRERVRGTAPGL